MYFVNDFRYVTNIVLARISFVDANVAPFKKIQCSQFQSMKSVCLLGSKFINEIDCFLNVYVFEKSGSVKNYEKTVTVYTTSFNTSFAAS